MKQATFGTFLKLDISPTVPSIIIYDCRNCVHQRGFAGNMVQCLGKLKPVRLAGCSSWSDGKDLVEMARFAPPKGWLPKKWSHGPKEESRKA
jgi:hypothetical protein